MCIVAAGEKCCALYILMVDCNYIIQACDCLFWKHSAAFKLDFFHHKVRYMFLMCYVTDADSFNVFQ